MVLVVLVVLVILVVVYSKSNEGPSGMKREPSILVFSGSKVLLIIAAILVLRGSRCVHSIILVLW